MLPRIGCMMQLATKKLGRKIFWAVRIVTGQNYKEVQSKILTLYNNRHRDNKILRKLIQREDATFFEQVLCILPLQVF